jgi:hypothetical protein
VVRALIKREAHKCGSHSQRGDKCGLVDHFN